VTHVLTLETDRLLLRPFREEDLDAYAGICADPEVMRHVGEERPLSRAEAWRQMAFFREPHVPWATWARQHPLHLLPVRSFGPLPGLQEAMDVWCSR
jgi:RimJ/RimL family protein N-acetyltransferase